MADIETKLGITMQVSALHTTGGTGIGGSNRDVEVRKMGEPCILIKFGGLTLIQSTFLSKNLYHRFACGDSRGEIRDYMTYLPITDLDRAKKALLELENEGATFKKVLPRGDDEDGFSPTRYTPTSAEELITRIEEEAGRVTENPGWLGGQGSSACAKHRTGFSR
jgi:hypothetical protein